MTIIEKNTEVFEDEKRTRSVVVKTWEIYGTKLPREKNVPVIVWMSGCPALFLCCAHQDADIFLAVPISVWDYLKLVWRRLRH